MMIDSSMQLCEQEGSPESVTATSNFSPETQAKMME